jgi:hypothetical protein
VVSQIHAALEIWPTLIEICYFHKDKREFPQRRIDNKKPKRSEWGLDLEVTSHFSCI